MFLSKRKRRKKRGKIISYPKLIFGLFFSVDPQNGNDEEAMANSQFSLDKMDEALKALIENIRHRSGLLKICKSNVTTGSSANDDSEPDIR